MTKVPVGSAVRSQPGGGEHSVKLQIRSGFFADWFRNHGRDFPWRRDPTPYGILVAEVLLRQTRAEMVAEVWPRFMSTFGTPGAILAAGSTSLHEVLKPLGLVNQRSAALRLIAEHLEIRFGGTIPGTIDDLNSLPHVGLYTSRAVLCFGYGIRVPVVDTNVMRVFSRLFGIPRPRDIRRARDIWAAAEELLPPAHVEHNYGLLDFSSLVCRPRAPRCAECPLAAGCCYQNAQEKSSNTRVYLGSEAGDGA